ncbi:MAG: DUF1660 family phage protein [Rhodococcus sp. (in: high G+C Gram-positive bacteria)]
MRRLQRQRTRIRHRPSPLPHNPSIGDTEVKKLICRLFGHRFNNHPTDGILIQGAPKSFCLRCISWVEAA